MYSKFGKNQHLSQTDTTKLVNEIRDELKTSGPKSLIVFNYIVHKCDFHNDNFYESEHTIAKNAGCSVRTVKRVVALSRRLFMVKRIRRFNNSNIYSIPQWIRQPHIVDQLADLLPGLRNLLCLSILIPAAVWYQPRSNAGEWTHGPLYSTKLYKDLKNVNVIEHKVTKNEEEEHKNLQGGSCKRDTGPNVSLKPIQSKELSDFIEFYEKRLPRMRDMLASIGKTAYEIDQTIQHTVDSYTKNMPWQDIKELKSKGYL